MKAKRMMITTVLVLGLAAAAPAPAAESRDTKVKGNGHVDLLNGQDQTVSISVQVTREDPPLKNDPTVGIEAFQHRSQVESGNDDSNAHVLVTAPVIGSEGLFYSHQPGTSCISCGPLDTICALLGDRC